MLDEEILAEVSKIDFSAIKDTEINVNVPLTIPKALFMEGITGFAKSEGYPEKIVVMQGEGEEKNGVLVDNPESPLLFLANKIRMDIRRRFEAWVKDTAKKQAEETAQRAIDTLFS